MISWQNPLFAAPEAMLTDRRSWSFRARRDEEPHRAQDAMMESGLATLDEAFAFVERTGERHWLAELHRLRGEFLIQQGKDAEAEASLRMALDVARQQQAKSWELRVATSLGQLWRRLGRQVRRA